MRSNSQSLAEVIKDFLNDYRLNEKVQETNLKTNWEKWMGGTIAKYTTNIRLNQKKLTLHIDSSVIKNELHFSKQTVIDNLNKELGGIYILELIVF